MMHTPVIPMTILGKEVLIKREDQACEDLSAPPFSKIRGLMEVLKRLKAEGVETIGYTETSISMAGWGVAWGCKQLGLRAVIFDPQYKNTPPLLRAHRKQWMELGAMTIPLPAGRAKVNYYSSKRILRENWKCSVLLPLGLPFPETVEAASREMLWTLGQGIQPATIVVCVGSGTVCAGLLKALLVHDNNPTLIGVLSRTGSVSGMKDRICAKAGVIVGGLLGTHQLRIEDPGWEYTERAEVRCPFPCHPWYDLKAWEWTMTNLPTLLEPVLFWNIGRMTFPPGRKRD